VYANFSQASFGISQNNWSTFFMEVMLRLQYWDLKFAEMYVNFSDHFRQNSSEQGQSFECVIRSIVKLCSRHPSTRTPLR